MTGEFSSQAGLASFAGKTSMSARITVDAAVIEWGVPYDDTTPTLIMARTRDEARKKVREAVAAMSEVLDGEEPEWDAALSEPEWGDFKHALCDAQSGVFITEYEQEV